MIKWVLLGFMLFSSVPAYSQEAPEINTILMRSTFMLTGGGVAGTAFLIAKPTKENKDHAYPVLVTAAHVLNEMKGDTAVLVLRKRSGDSFVKVPYPIQIRRGGNFSLGPAPKHGRGRNVRFSTARVRRRPGPNLAP